MGCLKRAIASFHAIQQALPRRIVREPCQIAVIPALQAAGPAMVDRLLQGLHGLPAISQGGMTAGQPVPQAAMLGKTLNQGVVACKRCLEILFPEALFRLALLAPPETGCDGNTGWR